MNDEKTGGIVIGSVGGDLSLQAGGDIVAGNKTIINNIIQRIAKELTTTPYKFLASYEIADRDIFYGRDAVIEELAAQVGRHKVLLINGASGAGKSSLVNAGLIPRVADNGYTFVAFREYSDPLAQLQAYFDPARGPAPLAEAADGQGSLLQLIRGFGAFPIVIFLDQFERFFVRVADDKRRAFIAAFKHCLQRSEAKDLCFVLAFRREFLGQLTTEFEEQIPEFLAEAYRINLLPLSKAEAREAVLEPLEKTSLKIQYDEDFVDDVLLAGLAEQTGGGASIDPPHLQIVCNQLFEAARQRLQTRTSVLINRSLYDELGGAQNILNTYLDKVVEDVAQDPERIAVVHSILKTMVDAGTNTRSFVAIEDFKRALPDVNETEILKLIEKLLGRRVVEERKPAYSLSHEHMVGKVKEWFDPRELERKRAEETLNRGMMEWKNSGALLNRGQVERIRKWLPELAEEEHELLQASERNCLEEERKEAARRKLKKLSLYGAAGFTALVMMIGAYSWYLRVEADRAKLEALNQRDVAVSRTLSANSEAALSNNPELALLLAREAMRVKPTNEAEFSLRQALSHTPERTVHIAPPGVRLEFVMLGSSPDVAVVSGDEGTPGAVWNLTDGTRLADLPAGNLGARQMAFASRTSLAAIITGDDRFALVDTRNWAKVSELRGSYPNFSKDGNTLVLTLGDSIQVWQTRPLRLLRSIRTEIPAPIAPLVTPDGALVVAENAAFAVASGERVSTVTGFSLLGYSCDAGAFLSPDGSQLLAAVDSNAETFQLLDLRTGQRKVLNISLKSSGEIVNCVAFSPDGRRLAVGSPDGDVQLWELGKDQEPELLRGHTDQPFRVEFSPDGKLLLSTSHDGTARLWDVSEGLDPRERDLTRIGGGGDGVSEARFTVDGRHIVTAHTDGALRIWQTKSWAPTQKIESVRLTSDARYLLQSVKKERAALWDIRTGKLRMRLDRPVENANSAAVSADEKRIAGSANTGVAIWTLADGKQVLALSVASKNATMIAFCGDKQVVTVGEDNTVRIWDGASGQQVSSWTDSDDAIDGIVCPTTGMALVVADKHGDQDGNIRLRDLNTGALRMQISRGISSEDGSKPSFAAGPDSLLIAGGKVVDVWDLRTQRKLLSLVGFSDEVKSAWASRDGRFILSGSFWMNEGGPPADSNELRIWDTSTRKVFARWRFGPNEAVAFGADPTTVVAVNALRIAQFYWCEVCVPTAGLMGLAEQRLSRDFTAEERAGYLEIGKSETRSLSPDIGARQP